MGYKIKRLGWEEATDPLTEPFDVTAEKKTEAQNPIRQASGSQWLVLSSTLPCLCLASSKYTRSTVSGALSQ